VDERYCFQIPNGTKYEEAATIPATSITSELALFSSDSLGLHKEACAGQTILIWGGSCEFLSWITNSYSLIIARILS
jgi:NADPH:quinone reductase-like Zn-dependent oxidoreductase